MTDEVTALWARMQATSTKLTTGAPYKAGQGNENAYAQAYGALMKVGAVYPLKRKYRG